MQVTIPSLKKKNLKGKYENMVFVYLTFIVFIYLFLPLKKVNSLNKQHSTTYEKGLNNRLEPIWLLLSFHINGTNFVFGLFLHCCVT